MSGFTCYNKMKKVVYGHYTLEGKLFYIGTGSLKRAYSKHSRNKLWKKITNNGANFSVELLYQNLEEDVANYIERRLIETFLKEGNVTLCNFCIGGMHDSHWLKNSPKERHPMYGKQRPDSSLRMSEWNKGRSGSLSPTFGLKRPDLAARNKANARKIRLIELDLIFESCSDLKDYLGVTYFKYNVVGNPNRKFRGYHFEYVV